MRPCVVVVISGPRGFKADLFVTDMGGGGRRGC